MIDRPGKQPNDTISRLKCCALRWQQGPSTPRVAIRWPCGYRGGWQRTTLSSVIGLESGLGEDSAGLSAVGPGIARKMAHDLPARAHEHSTIPPIIRLANCVCGKHLTIEHALSCPCGGFPSIRHNELRDLTAQFLTETCRNVGIEPTLQPLGDEHLRHRTAIREDGARLDIVAENFWGRDRQNAFFDVRVFNPYAQSHRSSTLVQCYRRNEQEKKRSYEERVREVEHGSFSPLIFSTSGGLGPIATVVYKRIASLIAEKRDQPYSRTLFWLRCKLSFSLLRSAIMCIRGSRSSYHHPSRTTGEAIDLICSESRIA